jgi:hypothetical protein
MGFASLGTAHIHCKIDGILGMPLLAKLSIIFLV